MKKNKSNRSNQSVFVAFFDLEKKELVEVETISTTPEGITMSGVQLTALFESGKHRLPSSVWLSFDLKDQLRVFFLDGVMAFQAQPLLDSIQSSVVSFRQNFKLIH